MFKQIAARAVNTIKAAVPHTPQDAAAVARAATERSVRMGYAAGNHISHGLHAVLRTPLSKADWSK